MKISMMSTVMMSYPPEEIVKTAAKCRMAGIDWVTEHNSTAKRLRKLCDDAGLPTVVHTPVYEFAPWTVKKFIEKFKRSVEFASVLGAPVMMIPVRQIGFGSRELDRAMWIEAFAKAAPIAKKAGITLTFEAMGFALAPVKSAAECLQVLSAVPELRITFDSGNVETVEDPIVSYCKLADKVVHVHLKDFLRTVVPSGPNAFQALNRFYYRQVLFGEGGSDLETLWRTMKGRGYQGYVNFETCSDKMPPQKFLKILCDRMRNW